MKWRRNIEDRDRLECIHWPTWGPHKGHIHQRTKVLFPQHRRSGSSTSYLRFSKQLACTKG